MRHWLVRAHQHDNIPFGPIEVATHRVVCGSGHGHRCPWKTSEVGDQVALVRIRNHAERFILVT
jgi:hypothetical protein